MEKRSVLGKGLSALIPDHVEGDASSVSAREIKLIAVQKVMHNSLQPRLEYEPEKLEELKNSIREKGVLQPILVRHKNDGYEVVAGERRLRAAQSLGLEEIPALIKDVSDEEALVLALIENIQREELNPIEEGKAYKRLMDEFHLNQEQVADAVGKERPTVSNILRLLKLPQAVQDAVAKKMISMGHARTLLSIEDKDKQYQVFLQFLEGGISVRQAEQISKASFSDEKRKKSKPADRDHEIVRLEEELQRVLGTKVKIDAQKKRGKIVIEYYSLEDLDRILEKIRG
ncbi:MAG TPA: ParB/RepB/Spo0J family partition protein [Candidatus Omnitrophota bacterium]|nr:ParB/RepB/Spo0J family partition protein [Candidatus Omnitrophota bacterium]HSA30365.1 ParB/RepB/Spo0J family partition protein [Candidatus Omnitrophota bacterium]